MIGATGTGVIVPQGAVVEVYANGTNIVAGNTSAFAATTASLGGVALLAGEAASVTTTVPGATTAMAVATSPQTYPGAGVIWDSYVSAANTVVTQVTAVVGVTPVASLYNVRVLP